MSLLTLRNIGIRRGTRTILSGVNLSIAPGERVALAGPNGVGKSSLLAVIAGYLKASEGEVLFDNAPVTRTPPDVIARRRALVAQYTQESPGFSVRDVIELGRLPHARNGNPAADEAAVHDAMERVGITDLADREVASLSGGQRQLVQMARALAQLNPARDTLLLLDEPTASLDPRHTMHLLHVADQIATQGAAVVVVLHDLNLVSQFATRTVLLGEGGVRADGPTDDVLRADLLAEVYQTQFAVLDGPPALGRLVHATPLTQRADRLHTN